jgi:hypothetical protein
MGLENRAWGSRIASAMIADAAVAFAAKPRPLAAVFYVSY